MRFLMRWMPVLAALALTGCFQARQDFVVNPDGSGKAMLRVVMPIIDLSPSGQEKDRTAQIRSFAKQVMDQSKGVEAWKDTDCRVTDAEEMLFSGTAYFRNLTEVTLFGMGQPFSFSRNGDGTMTLEIPLSAKAGPAVPREMSEEEIAGKVRSFRAEYRQKKPFLAAFFTSLKLETRIRLPGTVKTLSAFTGNEDGSISFTIEGNRLLSELDALMADDSWVRRQVISGRTTENMDVTDSQLLERITGGKGPVRATVAGPFRTLFDYETELFQARAESGKIAALLGAVKSVTVPTSGRFLRNTRVTAVHAALGTDTGGLTGGQTAYTLSLQGELPGVVEKVSGGRTEKAVADNGESFVPAEEFQRRLHFPRISEDRTSVSFGVLLNLPDRSVTGWKEISGTLDCVVSARTRSVDLGFAEIRAGAAGKECGAKISSLSPAATAGEYQVILELDADRDVIRKVSFQDATGAALEAVETSTMTVDGRTSLHFTVKGNLPRNGRVVAEIVEQEDRAVIPFRIEDISLLGVPRKQ